MMYAAKRARGKANHGHTVKGHIRLSNVNTNTFLASKDLVDKVKQLAVQMLLQFADNTFQPEDATLAVVSDTNAIILEVTVRVGSIALGEKVMSALFDSAEDGDTQAA